MKQELIIKTLPQAFDFVKQIGPFAGLEFGLSGDWEAGFGGDT